MNDEISAEDYINECYETLKLDVEYHNMTTGYEWYAYQNDDCKICVEKIGVDFKEEVKYKQKLLDIYLYRKCLFLHTRSGLNYWIYKGIYPIKENYQNVVGAHTFVEERLLVELEKSI